MAADTRKSDRKPRKASAKARRPARPRAAARATALDTAAALAIGAAVLTVGAALAGFLARRQIAARIAPGGAAHEAPDLAPDKPRPDAADRAPVDFRPDMDAPMSAAEREALRPAAGPGPVVFAAAGTMNSQTGADD